MSVSLRVVSPDKVTHRFRASFFSFFHPFCNMKGHTAAERLPSSTSGLHHSCNAIFPFVSLKKRRKGRPWVGPPCFLLAPLHPTINKEDEGAARPSLVLHTRTVPSPSPLKFSLSSFPSLLDLDLQSLLLFLFLSLLPFTIHSFPTPPTLEHLSCLYLGFLPPLTVLDIFSPLSYSSPW